MASQSRKLIDIDEQRNLRYEIADIEDREMILDFIMEHYIVQEEASRSLGATREQMEDSYRYFFDHTPFISILVLNNDRLIAVLVSVFITPEELQEYKSEGVPKTDYSEEMRDIIEKHGANKTAASLYMLDIGTKHALANSLHDFKKILHQELIIIVDDFKKQGLANGLTMKNLELAKEHECDYATIATSLGIKPLKELGFETLTEIKYADFLADGKELFPELISKSLFLMSKRI